VITNWAAWSNNGGCDVRLFAQGRFVRSLNPLGDTTDVSFWSWQLTRCQLESAGGAVESKAGDMNETADTRHR